MIKNFFKKFRKDSAEKKDKEILNELVNEGSKHINELKKIDSEIFAIQRSTKTTFSFFSPVHNYCRTKYEWYYNWHTKPYATKVHVGVLTLLLVFSLAIGSFSMLGKPNSAKAADYTCTFDGSASANWNDPLNWDADAGCNGEYPGQTEATVYDVTIPIGLSVTLNVDDLNLNNLDNTSLGNISVFGILTTGNNDLSFGSMTINSGGTVTAGTGNTLTAYGSWDHSAGTFTANTSTVNFAGTGTITVTATPWTTGKFFNNVNLAASTKITTLATSIYVKNLTIGAGTVTSSSKVILISGTGTSALTNSSSGTITSTILDFTGNGDVTLPAATNYATINAEPAGGNRTFTIGGNVTVTGSFNIYSKTDDTRINVDLNGKNFTVTSIINIGQSWSTPNKRLGKISNSSVTASALTAGSVVFCDGNSSAFDPDNTIDATNINISITGSGTAWNNGDDANSFQAGSSTVTFNGSGAQAITGINTWHNLTINNGAASPSDSVDVDPGAVQTVSNTLTVSDGQWTPYTGDSYKDVSITANGIVKPDSSAGVSVSGNWSNAGTFTSNSGTVTMTGSDATIGGTAATTFQYLNINGIVTDNVGSSVTTLTISGTISVALGKTITVAHTGNLIVSEGGKLSGEGRLLRQIYNSSVAITNSGTIDIATFSYFIRSGTTTGIIGATTYGGNLAILGQSGVVAGVLQANDLIVSGSISIYSSTDAGVTTVNNSNNINVNCTDLTIGGGSGNSARYAVFNPGTGTMTVSGTVTVNTTDASGISKIDSTGVNTLWNIAGNVVLNDTWIAGSSNISVGGNWANSGTFTAGTGAVTFNSVSTSIISGSTTFYNLTFDSSAGAKTVKTTAATTQTIAAGGTLSLSGAATDKPITYQSTTDGGAAGDRFTYALSGNITGVNYANVRDFYSSGYTVTPIASTCINNGNNNWVFNQAPNAPTLTSIIDGSLTSDNTPSLGFSLSDPDSGSGDTVQYQIQIFNNSDFASEHKVADYISELAAVGDRTFTVGQAAGSGSYQGTGSEGQTLSDSAYYWQIKAIDSHSSESSFVQANSGGVAFIIDITPPTAAITYSDADRIVKAGDVLTITATFNEPMADSPVVKIAISGANTQAATVMTKSSSTVYTYDHTVGSGDGTATVAMSVGTDTAGNTITAAPTSGADFTVDNTAPIVNAGADKTTNTQFTQDATVTGASTYQWSKISGTGTITFGSETAEDSTISADTDTTYVIRLTATDAAGNSASDEMTLVWDTAPPTADGISINTGATYTTSRTVNIAITNAADAGGSGLDQMTFSNDNSTWSDYESYGASKTGWSLAAGADSARTVYLKLKDHAGNTTTASISSSIILDTTVPAGTIAINASSDYTNSTNITLNITATDTNGINQMKISTNADLSGSDWESYATTKSSTIAAPDGTKTVYIQFNDNAGNNSTIVSDTILLDTASPSVGIQISGTSGDNSYYKTAAPTVTLTPTDGTGSGASTTYYRWGGTGSFTAYTTILTVPNEGTNTLNYYGTDLAGNSGVSSYSTQEIKVDTIVPTASISIDPASPNGTDEWYKTVAPTVTLSATDAASGQKEIKYKWNTTDYATYDSALTAPDGTNTLYYYSVDNAGNISSVTSQVLKVDTTPPSVADLNYVTTNPTNNLAVIFNWQGASDASGSGIDHYLVTIGSTTGASNLEDLAISTTNSFTKTFASAGIYYIRVQAVDKMGYVSDYSEEGSVTIDLQAPMISIEGLVQNQFITTKTLTISGTSADSGAGVDYVELFFDGIDTGKATSTNNYANWSYEWNNYSDGLHQIIAKSIGKAGNITSTMQYAVVVDTVAPTQVADLRGLNISNTNANVYAAYLDFAGSTDETSKLKTYELYRNNTKIADISPEAVASNQNYTGNDKQPFFYVDTDLSNTSYSYKVKAIDNAGNDSITPDLAINLVSDSIASNQITEAKIIPSKVVDSNNKTSAVVVWLTSLPSTTQVLYGSSNAYGQETEADKTLNQGHTVLLQGLNPATTYHIQAKSIDIYGRESKSEDLSFTSTIIPKKDNVVDLIIKTLQQFFNSIFGSNAKAVDSTQSNSLDLREFSNNLQVTDGSYQVKDINQFILTYPKDSKVYRSENSGSFSILPTSGTYYVDRNLSSSISYQYRIDENQAIVRKPIVGDDSALTITEPEVIKESVMVDEKNGQLMLKWQTSRSSTSQVEFGTSISYGQKTKTEESLNKTHSMLIEELTPGSAYHFRTISTDSKGSTASSNDIAYTLPDKPIKETPVDIILRTLNKFMSLIKGIF
ncbi:MAG: Ig-like domain-containing protein [Patescibacteria group bacterium]